MTREQIDQLGEQVIGALIEVHRHLGPGLLESIYEQALCRELTIRGIPFRKQVEVPVYYKEVCLDAGYRLDVLVGECIIVELKAVVAITPVFEAQILSHLRLFKKPLGYLANFHVSKMTDGIRRFANFQCLSDSN
jgi:GxxExxY protein